MTKEWYVNEEKAWFKRWWPKNLPKNVEIEHLTIGEVFERQRKKYADKNLSELNDAKKRLAALKAAAVK